jgi:hypothetical protein
MMRGWLTLFLMAWSSTSDAQVCEGRIAAPPDARDFSENSRRVCAAWPARAGCLDRPEDPDAEGSLRYFLDKQASEPCVPYYAINAAELLEARGRRVEAYLMYQRVVELQTPAVGSVLDAQREALSGLGERARARIPELSQNLVLLQLEPDAGSASASELDVSLSLSPRSAGGTRVTLDAPDLTRHVERRSTLVLEPGEYALDLSVAGCPEQSETLFLEPGRSSRSLRGLRACTATPSMLRLGVLTRFDVALHEKPGGALRVGLSIAPGTAWRGDAAFIAAPHNGGLSVGARHTPFSRGGVLSRLGIDLAALVLLPWPGSEDAAASIGGEAALSVALPFEGTASFAAIGAQYYPIRPSSRYSPALMVVSVGSRWGQP